VRLVSREVIVDGKPMRIEEVLRDPNVCGLLSNEETIEPATYPTTLPSTLPTPNPATTPATKP